MKKVFKILLVIIILLALACGGYYYYKVYMKNKGNEKTKVEKPVKKEEKKKVKIYDENSKERNVAVMIDNNTHAWPHSGINSAYCIYEMEVEGGESRLMALFKNKKDIDKVGPIRSARHYFLNYALEHDAIYTHIGQSPKAESDLRTLNMADINGQWYDSMKPRNNANNKEFWREKSKVRPHNAYTTIAHIFEAAKERKYNIESEKGQVFKYSVDPITLDKETSKAATKITAGYAGGTNNRTVFNYDEEKKEYTKTSKGVKQIDELTKEPYTIKNLIILKANTTHIDDKRLDVANVGTLEGYYITNGRAEKIAAKKESRSAKTKYFDETGKEIVFNDGRTYIMVIRTNYNIGIEGVEPEEPQKVEETNAKAE